MNTDIEALRKQRNLILEQMHAIDRLRRGSLSRQFFKAQGQDAPATHGPYFILQGFFHGQKFSERIPADQAPQVQEQVDNYRRFQTLAEEFVTVCDQITRWESPPHDSKKNSNSRRSPKPAFKKPKPS
jgi:hypothetical protein